ncbi:polysaccharide biosynthesis/export family protein [uncultured Litoreibacter sp.]|uniref:polysaccharide biosynthesis/export family protein n=1 Tax=uncultured Litoreibacter sp. TaxID=1392394 RepID=UPI00262AB01F|nr:polysaccharide biosynthesis/export family protein [uncultured Litoreibacter sp.]
MRTKLWLAGLSIAILAVSGCALPRGAALQSEIVKQSDNDEAKLFAVYPVTQEFLPRYADWPKTGKVRNYAWISKQKGPIGRVLLPGDSINIAIWDSDENSLLTAPEQRIAQLQVAKVSTNGTIFLPYVGSVRVSGLTERVAREKIQESFLAVSPSAQVQITTEPGSRHSVDLVSGVNNPGSFPLLERDMTVLSAIASGGGARESFENPHVRLLRGNKTYAISLDKLFKSPSLDTTLRHQDKLLVVEDESYFLTIGASGREEIITFPHSNVNALEAVSLMGGLSDGRANPEGLLILREYGRKAVRTDGIAGPENSRVVFTLDLTSADGLFSAKNFTLNPKDVVYATESPVNNARTIFSLIGSVFGVANQVSN